MVIQYSTVAYIKLWLRRCWLVGTDLHFRPFVPFSQTLKRREGGGEERGREGGGWEEEENERERVQDGGERERESGRERETEPERGGIADQGGGGQEGGGEPGMGRGVAGSTRGGCGRLFLRSVMLA